MSADEDVLGEARALDLEEQERLLRERRVISRSSERRRTKRGILELRGRAEMSGAIP